MNFERAAGRLINRYNNTGDLYNIRMPKTYKYLGTGCQRAVFLWRGFVLKVGYYSENVVEFESYLKFAEMKMPQGWGLPVCDLITRGTGEYDSSVSVQEYIPGDMIAYSEAYNHTIYTKGRSFLRKHGLGDLHDKNVILSSVDGLLYPVDMGYFNPDGPGIC